MIPRELCQPASNLFVLMRGVVVKDKVNVKVWRNIRIEMAKELEKPLGCINKMAKQV